MAARVKPLEPQIEDAIGLPADDSSPIQLADGSEAKVASPAHLLHQKLHANVSVREPIYAPRLVIATIIVFCFSVWWALFQLVSSISGLVL